MKHLVIISLALFISACVSPTVLQKPSGTVEFAKYKSVAYKIHDTPQTEYGSDAEDVKFAKDTIALFDTLLGAKLKNMGYTVVSDPVGADLAIDVSMVAVKPGSAAARFWVGMGAGRAVTLFDASFKDSTGASLASFEGGRSYTGMEFGKAFAGKDDISTWAATRSVSQIEEFMTNGGHFKDEQQRRSKT